MRKFHFPKEKIEQTINSGYKFTHIIKTSVKDAVVLVFQDEYKDIITVCEQHLQSARALKSFAECRYDNAKSVTRESFNAEINKINSALKTCFAENKQETGREI